MEVDHVTKWHCGYLLITEIFDQPIHLLPSATLQHCLLCVENMLALPLHHHNIRGYMGRREDSQGPEDCSKDFKFTSDTKNREARGGWRLLCSSYRP